MRSPFLALTCCCQTVRYLALIFFKPCGESVGAGQGQELCDVSF
jgi:hypothetical protein